MYNGGTSAATGVAGGLVAALRAAWSERPAGAPSGAAIKALLVVGAEPMRGRGGRPGALSREAGFGLIDVRASGPDAARLLADQDTASETGLETGETREYAVELQAAGRLRAALCWYDAPGEVLVNDLDLSVMDAAGTVVAGITADRANTVELIDVRLPAGSYRLVVTGHNVPAGPQRYALAVRMLPAS